MSEEDDKPNRQGESIRLEIGVEVGDKDGDQMWITIRELGRGAFGTVYQVVNKSSKQDAALKVERISTGDNILKIEKEIMEVMQQEPTAIHIFDDGVFNDFRYIAMTLCGPDLQKIAELMNNKFSQETVIRVCIRTLLAIKTLHEYAYVHRDLKPCNFAVDYNPNSLHVYLFDYGMARKYAKKENGQWHLRRQREQVQFRGTVRYCSLNMHKRKELARIDDVWSWFFMMMEMYLPLPWNSISHPDKVEAFKEDHLVQYLEKDPFFRSFVPIVAILNGTDYADRPDYQKLYEILYNKLREINGKLSGPMEYDAPRLKALSTETGETFKPKEQSKMDDEATIMKYLSTSFSKPGIPGGQHYIMKEEKDFFIPAVEKKKVREERTDEIKKNKRNRASAIHAKNKLLGKPKQPSSGTSKNEQSSAGSKLSGTKKPKGSKK